MFAAEDGGLRGGQVVRDDDDRLLDRLDVPLVLAHEIAQHPPFHVPDVVHLGLEGVRGHCLEALDQFLEDNGGGVLGGKEFFADALADGFGERRILQHAQVEAEHLGSFLAQRLFGLGHLQAEFVGGGLEGVVEAVDLAFDGVGRNGLADNAIAFLFHEE